MGRQKNSFFSRLRILLTLSLVAGCTSSPNPAAPPAPPAELPSLLVFPETIEIDVSKISSEGQGGEGAALISVKRQEAPNFSDAIAIGAKTADVINSALEDNLKPITQFEIPVSPTQKNFTAVEAVTEGTPGTFKFDFTDFDLDGDGSSEGCTGCTCPIGCSLENCPSEAPVTDLKPVCFRVWVQDTVDGPFRQFMAGLFEVLPVRDDPDTEEDEGNPGKGRFRTGTTDTVTTGGEMEEVIGIERFLIGAIYDHKDPSSPSSDNKSTELFFLNDLTSPSSEILLSQSGHALLTQLQKLDPADKSYLEKTVKVHFESEGEEGGMEFSSLKDYTGRFREDEDFWSGSVILQETGFEDAFIPTTCARISTGEGVLQNICEDLAIDTSDEDVTKGQVIDPVKESDVLFPADFPESPTF